MTAPEFQTRRHQSYSNVHQFSPVFMKFLCLILENLGMFAMYFHSQIIINLLKVNQLCCRFSFGNSLTPIVFEGEFLSLLKLNEQVKEGNQKKTKGCVLDEGRVQGYKKMSLQCQTEWKISFYTALLNRVFMTVPR